MLPKARCSWPLAPVDRLLVPGPGLLAIADRHTHLGLHLRKVHYRCACLSVIGRNGRERSGVPFWAFLNPALMSYKDRFETVDFKSFKSMVAGDPAG